jgi:hypothetical protein
MSVTKSGELKGFHLSRAIGVGEPIIMDFHWGLISLNRYFLSTELWICNVFAGFGNSALHACLLD